MVEAVRMCNEPKGYCPEFLADDWDGPIIIRERNGIPDFEKYARELEEERAKEQSTRD